MKNRATRVAALATALVAIGTVGGAAQAAPTTAASPATTRLTADVVPGLAQTVKTGAVAADAPMRVAVATAVDQSARDAAYAAMYTPGSASFHHFLSPTQFNAEFGANRDLATRVQEEVTATGLQVTYSSPDGSYLLLSGTASQVEKTFSVHENTYRDASGAFTANDVAPTVPAGVVSVLGLTSKTRFTTAAAPAVAPAQSTCRATMCIGTATAADLWSIYGQPSTSRGAGQKVAIFGEGQLDQVVKNLRIFESTYKLPVVPVRRVLVGDDSSDNAGQGEWDLDSDASTGMAPDLQELDYYFGSDLSDASIGGTYSAWVNDDLGPMTGNSSFGGPEQLEYLGGFILERLLQQGAMEGRTMFASAGDGGGSCLPGANGVTNDAVPCVEYPASSPYVTGVGGTVLYSQATTATGSTTATQTTPAARNLEYAWTYSGGGQSSFLKAPAYQVAAFPGATGVPCTLGPNQGATCRGVPDVAAMSGDGVNAYAVVTDVGATSAAAGTSLSSPLWAGMWARVAAAHPATGCATSPAGSGALGFAQPALYAVSAVPATDAQVFFDLGGATMSQPTGNAQQVALPRSAADPTGYDYVTGLGTPQSITALMTALDCGTATQVANTTPASLDVSTVPTLAGCGTNGVLTPVDATGDEQPATPANAALDITTVTLTSDPVAQTTTFSMGIANLAGNAAGPNSYGWEFNYDNMKYAVAADHAASGDTFGLYTRSITVTAIGLGVESPPTALTTALTGTVGVTPNVVTLTLPWAMFNSTAKPADALGVGSTLRAITMYTGAGTVSTNLPNAYNAAPTDQAEFFQCPYTIQAASLGTGVPVSVTTGTSGSAGTSTGSLASTGLGWGLPALAVTALVGGGVLVRRRRA